VCTASVAEASERLLSLPAVVGETLGVGCCLRLGEGVDIMLVTAELAQRVGTVSEAILLELGYWNFSGAWMLVLGAFALTRLRDWPATLLATRSSFARSAA
jgi:hypothetical protein